MKRYPPPLPRQYISGQGSVGRFVLGVLVLIIVFGACGVFAALRN